MKARAVTIAVTLVLTVSMPVMADQKVVQVTAIDNPQQQALLKQMSPEERAEAAKSGIGHPLESTYCTNGTLSRWDVGTITILYNSRTGQSTTLNRQSRQYMTQTGPSASTASSTPLSVTATHQSKMLLGHRALLYQVSMGDQMSGQVWAAADLPSPILLGPVGHGSVIREIQRRVRGMPLLVILSATTVAGDVTITSRVKSVSEVRLPASTYAIPSGFQAAPAGAGVGAPSMPGMGL